MFPQQTQILIYSFDLFSLRAKITAQAKKKCFCFSSKDTRLLGLSSSPSLSKGAVHPKIIIYSQNNIRINLSLRRKFLHIKQLICLLAIAIALFDDLFQQIELIVWKPILEFHQGPHMATIILLFTVCVEL